METPVVKLSAIEAEAVYEPSEDSFLLIDALEGDLEMLQSRKPNICLEVGSGSGVLIAALALAATKSWPSIFMAIDLNPEACRITKRTGRENCVDLEVVRMDLVGAINSRNIFDLIIFNPPYVLTESNEISAEKMITRSWAGGKKGREVMDRIFPDIPRLLSDEGLFYLVVVRENEPEEILQIFAELGMFGKVVAERKVRGEHLHVLRFEKKTKSDSLGE